MSRQNERVKRNTGVKTNYYVDGNTVRRLEGEPEERRQRQREKEQEQQRKRNRHAAKRNQEKELRMNKGYVVFCTLALALTCGVCVAYIHIQSEITTRMKQISSLESRIADLKADNDAALKRVEISTDLEAIKNKAINELGMVNAKAGQIVYYSIEDDDFMNQYSDIPSK